MKQTKTLSKITKKPLKKTLKLPTGKSKKESPIYENSETKIQKNIFPLEMKDKLEYIVLGMKMGRVCEEEKLDKTEILLYALNKEVIDFLKNDNGVGLIALISEYKANQNELTKAS